MTTGLALVVASLVGAVLGSLAVADARVMRVPVRPVQMLTLATVLGLGLLSAASGSWPQLAGAVTGAVIVTSVQALPLVLGRRTGRDLVGAADVRLGVPFGWTLGWFGVGFAVVGLAAALLGGLGTAAVLRSSRVPFVPAMAAGYWLALLWWAAAGL